MRSVALRLLLASFRLIVAENGTVSMLYSTVLFVCERLQNLVRRSIKLYTIDHCPGMNAIIFNSLFL